MRYLKAFGQFWWDFFVGDTPEIAIGALLLLGLSYLLGRGSGGDGVAAFVLTAGVVAVLATSVALERRRR